MVPAKGEVKKMTKGARHECAKLRAGSTKKIREVDAV